MNAMLCFAETASQPLEMSQRVLLSAMMFLEFAIWGGWFVVLGNYLNTLGFTRKQIARVYTTMPIGAIIAPMFVGTIADRYFAAEHVMAASHLIGGLLLLVLSRVRTPLAFFWVALAYAIAYSPTLSLVNAVVFANVPKTSNFPELRAMGTIGWIVAGMSLRLFIKPGQPVNNSPILLAAALSFVLAAFSLILPHTPPGTVVAQNNFDQKTTELGRELENGKITQTEYDRQRDIADEQLRTSSEIPFVRALRLFNDPPTAVFFVGSLVIAMAMAVYFAFAALYLEQGAKVKPENIGPVMTLGQWVEIIFLYSLSWFIDSWGMRAVLLIGMGAWALRFGIFAARPAFWLIAVAVGLHGICFDFFFAAGMINTKNIAERIDPGILVSAQSLYGVLVYGFGMWLGTEAAGWWNQRLTRESVDPTTGAITSVTDWAKFWAVPCVCVLVALVAFLVFSPA